MRNLLYIIILLTAMSSCIGGANSNGQQAARSDTDTIVTVVNPIDTSTMADTTLLALTTRQVDSIVFRLTHHYTNNFNFLVKADTLTLIPRDGDQVQDTCHVHSGDLVAVAEIKMMPTDTIDSIWVKVARDQYTMGWIPERELLRGTTPDDMISELLYALSSSRAVWMTALVVAGALALLIRHRKRSRRQLLNFDAMASPYPFLFIAAVAIMAALYASVQNFVPEFWQEYYYHPTLNPLVLPPLMAALMVTVWLVVILFVAVLDEVYHHFYLIDGVTYLAELVSVAMMAYLAVSWATLVYIGYPLLLVLLAGLCRACAKAMRG